MKKNINNVAQDDVKDYAGIAKKYCDDVMSGKIPACKLVILACKRHLNDLEKSKSPDYPYEFNPELTASDGKKYYPVTKRCLFSELLTHTKGKWAGTRIVLQPHQIFMQATIFGWVKKKNGKRRFAKAYIELPRKNGKSIDAATTGLYMLMADGEKGAECLSGATTEKQALEVFRPAWQMVNANPKLREKFGVSLSGTPKNPTSIYRLSDMSRFELLIGNPGDGASPHCGIHDECHEFKTFDQPDTVETGMGAREQPLQLFITTAGTDTSLPCYDLHLRCVKILEGTIEDESMFCIIYTIDPEDKWQDFSVWEKANPNYRVSIEEDYLIRKHKETISDVTKQNINLCKHTNTWSNAGTAWMNMTKWAACCDPTLKLSQFAGQPCYAALDLASKIDICALVLLFQHKSGYAVFAKYYLPEETIQLAGNDHYVKWVKEGYITETPGARTDFLYIEDDLKSIHRDYLITELAFDPREATYLINNVSEWLGTQWVDGNEVSRCIEIPQGPALMSEPMKELEAWVYANTIWHNGDPVLTWMMGNVVKKMGRSSGPVKYYYPTKEKNEFKIDGPVAMIMAVSRAMKRGLEGSVYDGLSKEDMRKKLRGEL